MNAGRYAAGGGRAWVIMEIDQGSSAAAAARWAIWASGTTPSCPALKRCVDFIRLHNSVPGIQLGHSGRKARRFRAVGGRRAL